MRHAVRPEVTRSGHAQQAPEVGWAEDGGRVGGDFSTKTWVLGE